MRVSLLFAAILLTLTHPSHAQTAATLTLNAAGATFPAPLYQAWIASFREHHPDIHITYSAIGSEAGIQQLHDQKIAFAASDVPLSDLYMSQMPVKLHQFATAVGAFGPIYHLSQTGIDPGPRDQISSRRIHPMDPHLRPERLLRPRLHPLPKEIVSRELEQLSTFKAK